MAAFLFLFLQTQGNKIFFKNKNGTLEFESAIQVS